MSFKNKHPEKIKLRMISNALTHLIMAIGAFKSMIDQEIQNFDKTRSDFELERLYESDDIDDMSLREIQDKIYTLKQESLVENALNLNAFFREFERDFSQFSVNEYLNRVDDLIPSPNTMFDTLFDEIGLEDIYGILNNMLAKKKIKTTEAKELFIFLRGRDRWQKEA